MSLSLSDARLGSTAIPYNIGISEPLPPSMFVPVALPPPPMPPMMMPPVPFIVDPLPPPPPDMSLSLQNAGAVPGASRLSIGNIIGGIAGAAGGFLTGGIGGAISGGVSGFTGGPKPKPGIGIQMGGTFIGMTYGGGGSNGKACGMRGYHLDKKTHMRWVRNRHMNFGNSRANSRAIRRLHGAERQLKRIFRVMHGKKVRVLPKRSARGRR